MFIAMIKDGPKICFDNEDSAIDFAIKTRPTSVIVVDASTALTSYNNEVDYASALN